VTQERGSESESSTENREADDDGVFRRSYLKMFGVALGAASVPAATQIGRVTAAPGSSVDLGAEGLSSGDDISPYLDDHWQSGTEVRVPAGTYDLSDPRSLAISSSDDAWLVGDGEVVLEHGNQHVEFNIEAKGDAHVRVRNFTLRGVDTGDDSKVRAWAPDDSALVELINVNRPDGTENGEEGTGYFVPKSHAGVVRFINCHVENFTDNGLYGSAPGTANGGDNGAVEVYGGLWKNNDTSGIRVGSDDCIIQSAVVVNDQTAPSVNGGAGVQRGIRIRHDGENIAVDDCDVYHTDDAGVAGPFEVEDGHDNFGSGGSAAVTNTRIWNDTGGNAINTETSDYDITGDTIDLTGSGDYDLDGSYSNVITGSDATDPRTEKRWYDWGGETGGGGNGDGGSTDSPLGVTTGGATDVTGSEATLSGALDDLGGAESAEVGFQYREAGESDWTATGTDTLSSTETFVRTVSGLTEGADYEYRAVAAASDGDTTTGDTAPFSTTVSFDHHLVIRTVQGSGLLYEFVTTGLTEPGDAAELDDNDSLTQNDDGTYTVAGDTGNGYTDDWFFDGRVAEWTAEQHPEADSGEYELVLDGEVVTPAQLTGDDGPADTEVVVTTVSASDVAETTATLSGALDDLGGAESAEVGFQYREAGGSDWTATSSDTLSSPGTFTQSVSGLTDGTEHEFRAVAGASDGDTAVGSPVTFTTAAADVADPETGPTIDGFDVTEAGSPNPHADITAQWTVSDADTNLSRVLVQVVDANGSVVDASRTSVSAETASNVDYFRIKQARGESFDVTLLVTDAAGNRVTDSASVSER
jgi:hypothetical protein